MTAELTDKQARFVEQYLIDCNATRAAIRAGYSVRTAQEQGSRLLSNVIVAQAIGAAQADRSARVGLHADRVIEELAVIAFARLGDYVRWHGDRVLLEDSTAVDTRAVSEVSSQESKYGTSLKIKLHDKLGALKLLGQHLGILTDTVTVQFDVDQVSRELAEKYGTTPERVISIIERLRRKRAG